MSQRQHDLKAWPEFFNALQGGEKTFDVRRDDRGFAVGDTLLIREFAPNGRGSGGYTGSQVLATITYKLPGGRFGIDPTFCVLGLKIES